MEEWRDVPGMGGHYRASSLGRIRVKRRAVTRASRSGKIVTYTYRARLLRPHLQKVRGRRLQYKTVHLGWDSRRVTMPVHIMVLLAFHGPRPPGMVGCHNNSVSTDNRPDNLRWDTHRGNMEDRKRLGRYADGESHPSAKLSNAQARDLKASPLSLRLAAQLYGISKTQAARIRNGQRGGL